MNCYASNYIQACRQWLGYQEKASLGTRAQMAEKNWNAGYANLTIFWIWFKDLFGWTCQGQAWCFGFQTVMMARTFGKENAKRLWGGCTEPVNCQDFVTKMQKDTRLNDTPSVGAWVFFHNGKKWSHIGLVTGVSKTSITSIEGNTSGDYDKVVPDGGAVVEKSHKFATTTMKFWHPDYDEEEAPESSFRTYKIGVGADGLNVLTTLNYREKPNGKILGSFKYSQKVFPTEKTFVDSNVWYHDEHGWFSAKHLRGWVFEDNANRWWYLKNGYTYDCNKMFQVGDNTFYADATGYIVQSDWVDVNDKWYYFDENGYLAKYCYVKSTTDEKYYWVNEDGIWEDKWTTSTPNLEKYKLAR